METTVGMSVASTGRQEHQIFSLALFRQTKGPPLAMTRLNKPCTCTSKPCLEARKAIRYLDGKVGPNLATRLRILDDLITTKEVHRAVMPIPKNKASGPDGFPIEFFHKFWDIMASEIVLLIQNLQNGRTTITLIPKKIS